MADPVDQMGEQARRMDRMIDDLLCLARLEAEPVAESREWLDMSDGVRQAVADSCPDERFMDVECDERLWLHGDEKAVTSVITNLVSNACRYTPGTGRIQVTWRVVDEGAELSVRDNGCGMDSEHIPRLTERFYRADKGRDSATGGTGLGLAIVKHALANHQAELKIESKPGEGSNFICCFPGTVISKSAEQPLDG